MNTDPSSSPLAFFAAELKRLRGLAGMTQEALADATGYSAGLVGSIETCIRLPNDDFAKRADEVLGTDGHLARLQLLVEQTSVLPWFRDRIEVERKAIEIHIYASYVIPGLLQTEDYARCCVSATRPVLTRDEVERAVALRMTRQEILDQDDPPRLWVIIEESALRRMNGGSEVMAGQLMHLLRMSDRPDIAVQVIPESEGSTAAGGREFTIMTLRSDPAVAYLEDISTARYVRKPKEVSDFRLTYDYLRSTALSDVKSAELIREVARKFEQ